jgi:glycosyltransferase involved in cell wall biosynthesis
LKQYIENLRPDAQYFPTPIDISKFTLKESYNESPKAIYFPKPYESLNNEIHRLLKKNNIPLTIHNEMIPYNEMPRRLKDFDIFIDQTSIPALSKTCLEAMSCGLAVVDYRNQNLDEYIKNLSEIDFVKYAGILNHDFVKHNHNAKDLADQLRKIWRELY